MFRTIEISNPAYSPPGLRFVTVKSAALGQRADILLFVPMQAEAQRDVPLVLLLHGVYGSHWAWAFKGGAHLTAQRLIDVRAIPPLVLAMPSDGLWGDGSGVMLSKTLNAGSSTRCQPQQVRHAPRVAMLRLCL